MDFLYKALSSYFQPYAEQIAFVQVREDREVRIKEDVIPSDLPLPVSVKTVSEAVKGEGIEAFGGDELFANMLRVLVLDPEMEAATGYRKLLNQLDDTERQALLLSGLEMATAGRYSDALLFLLGYRSVYDPSLDVDYNIGRLLIDLSAEGEGTFFDKLALQTFEYLSALYPDFGGIDFHLGFLYYNQKAFGRAKKTWQSALASDDLSETMRDEILDHMPKLEHQVDFEEGTAKVLGGRAQEGLEHLLPLADKHEDWWQLHFFIGVAYRQLERFEEAIKVLKKVLDLHTGHLETLNELGLCFMALGDFTQAKKLYKEAVGLNPTDHELICNLGIATFYEGDPWTAQSLFEKSLDLQDDPITRAWLEQVKAENTSG